MESTGPNSLRKSRDTLFPRSEPKNSLLSISEHLFLIHCKGGPDTRFLSVVKVSKAFKQMATSGLRPPDYVKSIPPKLIS